jgi:SAM-dependent methyltransferase
MRKEHLKHLACPACRGDLSFGKIAQATDDDVETGTLECPGCRKEFPIQHHVPRFVPADNYASGFGLEWTKHARTQYDSYCGAKISETRFFNETKWPRQLPGESILEVGSGSGRFTEHAAATGALVVSVDYSYAVDANYGSNGSKPNVLIVQASVYELPLREGYFDKVFCFGVIQHTPDPAKTFQVLPRYLKPGGLLAADIYKLASSLRGVLSRLVPSKYWVRPFTKNVPPEILYRRCQAYINFMWPFACVVSRIPRLGHWLNWRLVIADYRGKYDLSEEMLKEWAILDTFDMLSPAYDYPQTIETFTRWFQEAGLQQIDVHYGYNGIEGRARKP